MTSQFHQKYLLVKKLPNNNTLSWSRQSRPNMLYKFRFTSLIPPYLLPQLRMSKVSFQPSTVGKSHILLKQSYLLFTWFYYLKESRISPDSKVVHILKFAFLPTRHSLYTLTKAPMAHKTNSKEQYTFRVFQFKASVKVYFTDASCVTSYSNALSLFWVARRIFPVFETNLLLLKSCQVLLKFNDSTFFSYFRKRSVCIN